MLLKKGDKGSKCIDPAEATPCPTQASNDEERHRAHKSAK